jgi:hypothetical protein
MIILVTLPLLQKESQVSPLKQGLFMIGLCTDKKIFMELKVDLVSLDSKLFHESLPSAHLREDDTLILNIFDSQGQPGPIEITVYCCEPFHLMTPERGSNDSFTVYYDASNEVDLSYSRKSSNVLDMSQNGINILLTLFGNISVKGKAVLFKNTLTPWLFAEVSISAIPFQKGEQGKKNHHSGGTTNMSPSLNMMKFGR